MTCSILRLDDQPCTHKDGVLVCTIVGEIGKLEHIPICGQHRAKLLLAHRTWVIYPEPEETN